MFVTVYVITLKIKRSMSAKAVAPVLTPVGVKLPKIDVPKFDGNMLNWQSFWECLGYP